MKEKPNPLAGLVDAMKDHDNRLARIELKPMPPQVKPVVAVTKTTVTPVQTVATMEKPRQTGEKVFCAARFSQGQMTKIDQILLLTHQKRGVRITQSDVMKKAIDRMPAAPLEEGEILEILNEGRRKQLNK